MDNDELFDILDFDPMTLSDYSDRKEDLPEEVTISLEDFTTFDIVSIMYHWCYKNDYTVYGFLYPEESNDVNIIFNYDKKEVEFYFPRQINLIDIHSELCESILCEVFNGDIDEYNNNVICTFDYYYIDESDENRLPRILLMK